MKPKKDDGCSKAIRSQSPRTADIPGVISVREAASHLGISLGTAYFHAKEGTLPTIRFGRRYLVPVTALARLIDASSASPLAASALPQTAASHGFVSASQPSCRVELRVGSPQPETTLVRPAARRGNGDATAATHPIMWRAREVGGQ